MYGKKIKDLRELNKKTQLQTSLGTSIPQNTISWIELEKGLPNIEQCIRLADYFSVTLDELIGRTTTPNSTFYTSSEEQELIKAYRQLSFDQQQVIKVQLGALVEVNK